MGREVPMEIGNEIARRLQHLGRLLGAEVVRRSVVEAVDNAANDVRGALGDEYPPSDCQQGVSLVGVHAPRLAGAHTFVLVRLLLSEKSLLVQNLSKERRRVPLVAGVGATGSRLPCCVFVIDVRCDGTDADGDGK